MILKIIKADCWNCNKEMRMAFLNSTIGAHEFDEHTIDISRSRGVIIEERQSSTMEEKYNANICPHCKTMTGQWYLSEYWYSEVLEEIEIGN